MKHIKEAKKNHKKENKPCKAMFTPGSGAYAPGKLPTHTPKVAPGPHSPNRGNSVLLTSVVVACAGIPFLFLSVIAIQWLPLEVYTRNT